MSKRKKSGIELLFDPMGRRTLVDRMTGLPKAESAIFKCLAQFADKNGYCYPGYKTLAERTGYSVKTVYRAMKRLEKWLYIRRVRRHKGNGHQRGYAYAITLGLRHCDLNTGQYERNQSDTESSLNYPIEQYKKNYDLMRAFEDKVIGLLKEHIDFNKTSELVSALEVSKHVFLALPNRWGDLIEEAVQKATELAAELRASGTKLLSWEPLTSRLAASTTPTLERPSITASKVKPQLVLDPRVEQLRQSLKPGNQRNTSLTGAIERSQATETNTVISFKSQSRRDADLIETECRRELKKLANLTHKKIELSADGQVPHIFRPQSSCGQ